MDFTVPGNVIRPKGRRCPLRDFSALRSTFLLPLMRTLGLAEGFQMPRCGVLSCLLAIAFERLNAFSKKESFVALERVPFEEGPKNLFVAIKSKGKNLNSLTIRPRKTKST